ncbi:hypothetical protein [Roseateles puraquae]|jgi:hypothetical protein|uniref:hypothetical protein n=1 Tax=Roseateles puraquae TaxID=431059 RepID=UPI0031D92CB6
MMKNTRARGRSRLLWASLGMTMIACLSACGGGGGGSAQGAPSTSPAQPAADPRETSVTPSSTVRWQGGGFDGIGLAGITLASDGGVWALGGEGGLVGRPFLRKIGGANTCGTDGQRFLTELSARFERRQQPVSLTTARGGQFYAAFMGPGAVYVARIDEATCAVDASFGDKGVIGIPITGLVTVTNVVLQRDNADGILVAAIIPGQLLLRRFTGSGVWDSQFGTNGLATNPNADSFWVSSLAVARNGDILVSGAVSVPVAFQPALLKLNSKGLPVSAFGSGGVQRYPSLSIGTGNTGTLLIEDDRVIASVATGSSVSSQDFTSNDSQVAAIDLQTGQLKADFGTAGSLIWDWGYNNTEATAWWMPNGRGGYIGCGHVLKSLLLGQSASLVDITANGKPDTTVGYQGRRLIAGTNSATCAGLLRMPDGRLVVAANDGGQAVVMFFDR